MTLGTKSSVIEERFSTPFSVPLVSAGTKSLLYYVGMNSFDLVT